MKKAHTRQMKAGEFTPAIIDIVHLYTRYGYTFASVQTADNVRISDLMEHQARSIQTEFGGSVGYSETLGWYWTATHRKAREFLTVIRSCMAVAR